MIKNMKRIIIFFSIIFVFILSGFFLYSFQKEDKYFSVRYSIEFNQKTIAILNTIDALMESIGVSKYTNNTFRKYLEVELYPKNKTSLKKIYDIKAIGFSTDSIFFETTTTDNLEERFEKFTDNLNEELWNKLSEYINVYKEISEQINMERNSFISRQLKNLQEFQSKNFLRDKIKTTENPAKENFTDDLALLTKIIEAFVGDAQLNSIPNNRRFLERIINELNTKLTADNLRYLVFKFSDERVETDINYSLLDSFVKELEKNKKFIIPLDVDKIQKNSPNIFMFLISFALSGTFVAFIYFVLSSKNLRSSMRKKLEL